MLRDHDGGRVDRVAIWLRQQWNHATRHRRNSGGNVYDYGFCFFGFRIADEPTHVGSPVGESDYALAERRFCPVLCWAIPY